MRQRSARSVSRSLLERLAASAGAVGLTLLFFLVLPLIQAISAPPDDVLALQEVETAELPPPPPIEEEVEEEPEPEEPPPELESDPQPLELSQLELALDPGFGSGFGTGDFEVSLENVVGGGAGGEGAIDFGFDQAPRVVYQPGPTMSAKMRKKAPGSVVVSFFVDEQGRVQTPRIETSSDAVFERPTLKAVEQWRFEPGQRNGEPVPWPMRIPITFPE